MHLFEWIFGAFVFGNVLVLYSDHPLEVNLSSAWETCAVHDFEVDIDSKLADKETRIVIDMTGKPLIWAYLEARPPPKPTLYRYFNGQITTSPPQTRVFASIPSLMSSFSWSIFNLLYTTTSESRALARSIQAQFPFADPVLIPMNISRNGVINIAGRLLQPRGKRFFVVVLPTELVIKVVEVGVGKKLCEEGSVWVVSSLSDAIPGEVLREVKCGLMQLTEYEEVPRDGRGRIEMEIEGKRMQGKERLYVSQGDAYVQVGECGEGCRLNGTWLFPGCTSVVPVSPYAHLLFTLPTQTYTADEASFLPHIQGALYAISDLNSNSAILPNHQILYQSFYYGVLNFNQTAAVENAMKLKFRFGSMISAAFSTEGVIGLFRLLGSWNVTEVIVGSEVMIPLLTNSTQYPYFVRTIVSDAYIASFYSEWFHQNHWSRCSVLYRDNLWSTGFYMLFQAYATQAHIQIANNPELRLVPSDYNGTNYPAIFQEIKTLKTRIVMIVSIEKEVILHCIKSLYSAGIRRGDIVIVAVGWLVDSIWSYFAAEDLFIFRDILSGAVMAFPAAYLTPKGMKLHLLFSQKMGQNPPLGACLFYDSMEMMGKALDYVIQTGQDAENPRTVINAIRGTKLKGCSGLVTIDPTSNDRSQMSLLVQNLRYWEGNETWELAGVLVYNPSSSVLYRQIGTFVWPDGSSTTPSDTVTFDIDCPFPSRDLVSYPLGTWIILITCSFLLLTVFLTTLLIWNQWKSVSHPQLTQKTEISISDVIILSSVVIEFFQYVAMGPDSERILTTFPRLFQSLTLDLDEFFPMNNGGFWILLDFVYVICLFWVLGLVMTFYNLWKYVQNVVFCPTIREITELCLPIIGNIGFLPLVSVLLEVFLCDKRVGSEAILAKDCYQTCWEYPHTLYAALSISSLLFFLPPAIFTRPVWQELESSLHIKSSPRYLLLKTTFQVSLIVLNKTVKRVWPVLHGFVYVGLVLGFVGVGMWVKPGNYGRVNMWTEVLMLGNAWIGGICVMYQWNQAKIEDFAAFMVLAGLLFLGLTGLVIQYFKCPSMLYRKKGLDIAVLFRFQLGNRVSATEIQPKLSKVKDVTEQNTVF